MVNWIDVSEVSGTHGETEVEVTAAPNPGAARTAQLTGTTAAGVESAITITQLAPPYYLNLAINYANAATVNTRKNFCFAGMEWGTNEKFSNHPYPKFYTTFVQGATSASFFPVCSGLISSDFLRYVSGVMSKPFPSASPTFSVVLNIAGGDKVTGSLVSCPNGYYVFDLIASSASTFAQLVGSLTSEQIKVYLRGKFTISGVAVKFDWLLASYSIQV